jgi:hypothetical protein
VPPDPRPELRALALWHSRRRAVDDLLNPLLEYGPVAVDRVAAKLDAVRELVEEEREAFDAFVAATSVRSRPDAVVLELFPRRSEAD